MNVLLALPPVIKCSTDVVCTTTAEALAMGKIVEATSEALQIRLIEEFAMTPVSVDL
jgi:hypothetical protein